MSETITIRGGCDEAEWVLVGADGGIRAHLSHADRLGDTYILSTSGSTGLTKAVDFKGSFRSVVDQAIAWLHGYQAGFEDTCTLVEVGLRS